MKIEMKMESSGKRASVKPRRPVLAWGVHSIRVVSVVVLFLLLPSPHRMVMRENIDADFPPPLMDVVNKLTGVNTGVLSKRDGRGLWTLESESGEQGEGENRGGALRIGRTLPDAANTAGYRGPTEALFALDAEDRIVSVMVGDSHDTDEHVEAVKNATEFVTQFRGLTWGGLDRNGDVAEIDGVSGATLTSLAMAEGLMLRLGRASGSLLFNESLSDEEVVADFEDRGTVNAVITDPVAVVRDDEGKLKNVLIRSGPFSDEVIGYQGPTELLISLDENERIARVQIRRSLDNEPYVDYVREDDWFWRSFDGMTLSELAVWDPVAEQVEGVSGATMTSMAVAETLPRVAMRIETEGGLKKWTDPPPSRFSISNFQRFLSSVHLSSRDAATIGLIGLLWLLTGRGWMRNRRLRFAWLIAVVVVIGWWTGNLVSLALLTGWASSGVSWQLAIGLIALVGTAMILPPAMRGNPYCNHLCPHGAIQQLTRPDRKSWRHVSLPPGWARAFASIAPLTLVLAYGVLLFWPRADVSGLEPFYAYLWPIAGVSSVVLCVATLLVSCFVPMGYCRFGCPTGFLIGYLRRTSTSDRVDRIDVGLVLLLFVSFGRFWFS